MAEITKQPGMSLTTEDLDDNNKLANKLRSSADYLKQSEELLAAPEFQSTTPPETKKELQAAINNARELYNTQSNRNDWLEVAQTLGQALAKFGHAQASAKSGATQYIAPEFGSIDYGKRSSRALQEREQNIGEARTLASAGEEDWKTGEATRKYSLGQQLRLREQAMDEANREEARRLQEEREGAAEKRALGREAKQSKEEQDRGDLQERRLLMQENNREAKTLQDTLQARGELANAFQQESDLSPKSKEKLNQNYSDLAGRARVSIDEVIARYNREAPRKKEGVGGTIRGVFGMEQPIDKENAYKTLDAALGLTDMKNRLDTLRTQNKKLAVTPGYRPEMDQAGQEEKPVVESAGGKQDPTIAQYAKQYNLDYEAAKKVLIKRGHKPAE